MALSLEIQPFCTTQELQKDLKQLEMYKQCITADSLMPVYTGINQYCCWKS